MILILNKMKNQKVKILYIILMNKIIFNNNKYNKDIIQFNKTIINEWKICKK